MCDMNTLEVIPGRGIGRLHVLAKAGNFNGEDCYMCRDEKGRNIQFIESEIIAQASTASVEMDFTKEEVVEETPSESPKDESTDETEGEAGQEDSSEDEVPGGASVEMTGEIKEDNLDSLMDKPIENLEGQEIVAILIGKYGDNPPDDLTMHDLRERLDNAKKAHDHPPTQEKKSNKKKGKGGK